MTAGANAPPRTPAPLSVFGSLPEAIRPAGMTHRHIPLRLRKVKDASFGRDTDISRETVRVRWKWPSSVVRRLMNIGQ